MQKIRQERIVPDPLFFEKKKPDMRLKQVVCSLVSVYFNNLQKQTV